MTETIKNHITTRNAMSDFEYSLNTLKLEKLLSLLELTIHELEIVASGRAFARRAGKKTAFKNGLSPDNK